MTNQKDHWENVYRTKTPDEVSWTQAVPTTSLELILATNDYKSKHIIDIGGGDSNLVDFLLDNGCENITVLDISQAAIDRAKSRLGQNADKVNWIVSDINDFTPEQSYQIWHDRAAFHFLTQADQIERYVATANKYVNGDLIVGTFSEEGPKKCSGLDITQYSEDKMETTFAGFEKVSCQAQAHITPFETTQHFIFCRFKKT
jgi:2-polyprenyl-3-methyl-5-hydroxy-6-metoxy-1,4-benzoquinol methylase